MTPVERRRAERRSPAAGEPLSRLRLRTGRELLVLNIAGRGALVEGPRLIPGAYIDLHITTAAGRALVRSRVLRCEVSRVTADSICYRSGLVFEQVVDTAVSGYPVPVAENRQTLDEGSGYPAAEGAAFAPVPRALTA